VRGVPLAAVSRSFTLSMSPPSLTSPCPTRVQHVCRPDVSSPPAPVSIPCSSALCITLPKCPAAAAAIEEKRHHALAQGPLTCPQHRDAAALGAFLSCVIVMAQLFPCCWSRQVNIRASIYFLRERSRIQICARMMQHSGQQRRRAPLHFSSNAVELMPRQGIARGSGCGGGDLP
jgi:hypothetical protein